MHRSILFLFVLVLPTGLVSAERFTDSNKLFSFEIPDGWKAYENSLSVGVMSPAAAISSSGPGAGEAVVGVVPLPAEMIVKQFGSLAAAKAGDVAALSSGAKPSGPPSSWSRDDGVSVDEVRMGETNAAFSFSPDPRILLLVLVNAGSGGFEAHAQEIRKFVSSIRLEIDPAALTNH